MNETKYYEIMIQRYAVDDDTVERIACAPVEHRTFVWKKAVAIAAASLAVIVGTVFLIPSARAEVMRWFSATRPEEYLAADPEERVPVDALDILIVPPKAGTPKDAAEPTLPGSPEAVVPIANETPEAAAPIGSVTNNRILTVCDEPIWRQIAEDFSMELGETMFDGHSLFLSVTMHGLTALPEIERYTAGNATQVRIGKEDLAAFFENGNIPDKYRNEEVSEYEPMMGRFFLLLDDGSEIPFGPQYTIDLPWDTLPIKHENKGILTDAERAEISRLMIEWLPGKELHGVVKKEGVNENNDWFFRNGKLVEEKDMLTYLLSQADENGILSGTVLYRSSTDLSGTHEIKLEVELGTASFDLIAYRSIGTHAAESINGTVAWGAEPVLISKIGVDFNGTDDDEDDRISLYKQSVSMEGVTMTAETEQAEISALGVHNVCIRIRVPESWTREDREALAASLTFNVLINGERGDWIVSPYYCELEDDGTVLYKCDELLKVPYDKLKSLQTISFVPVIRSVKSIHFSGGALDTEYGQTAWSPLGVSSWNESFDRIEYPQYAITLNVQ